MYSNDKAGSADTSEGTDTTGNMDKAGSTDTTGNADTPGVSKLAASDNVLEGYCTFYDYVVAPYKGNVYGWGYMNIQREVLILHLITLTMESQSLLLEP